MNANNFQRGFNINNISKYRDSIMGVAIVGILLCHYNECRTIQGLSPNILSKFFGLGNCFVDVFLILSGVGLYYSFSKNNAVVDFYKRRLLRLLPTYLIIAVPYWIYHDMFLEGGSIVTVLYNLSFGSLLVEGVHRFWFVFLILILYLLFPFVYKALNVKGSVNKNVLITILAFLVVGGVLLNRLIPEFYSNIRIAFERIPVFIIGVYLGEKCKREECVSWFTVVLLFVATLAIELIDRTSIIPFVGKTCQYYACSMLGLSCIVVLCVLLDIISRFAISGRIEKILSALGGVTLESYLLHSAFKNIAGYPSGLLMYLFVAVLLPIPVGFLVSRICKKITRTI